MLDTSHRVAPKCLTALCTYVCTSTSFTSILTLLQQLHVSVLVYSLQREAQAIQYLSNCSSVVQFEDMFNEYSTDDNGTPQSYNVLVTKACGKNLLQYVREQRQLFSHIPMALQLVLHTVGLQVAYCISAVHSKGIVHGDIKPSNFVISADNSVRILDFECSVYMHEHFSTDSDVTAVQLSALGSSFVPSTCTSGTSAATADTVGAHGYTAAYTCPERAQVRNVIDMYSHTSLCVCIVCTLYSKVHCMTPYSFSLNHLYMSAHWPFMC
jgi:serine/threonine protein kinase